MGHVDNDAETIGFPDDLAPELGQAARRVRPGLHMAKLIIAEMDQLNQAQAVLMHPVQVFDVALQRIGSFKSREHGDLSLLA